jgi:predicted nucleic acid-binding protein
VIYLDAAYIGKCYLNEPGAERVQELAGKSDGLTSCEIGRLEFFSLIHRHRREGNITPREASDVLRDFERDEAGGVWHWLPVTPQLVRRTCDAVRSLPAKVLLRAGDALHLGCARENGFKEVYTNDRHMLANAPLFGLQGIDVIH